LLFRIGRGVFHLVRAIMDAPLEELDVIESDP